VSRARHAVYGHEGERRDRELIDALTGLRYTRGEAADAAARMPEDGDRPLEERVRQALQFFDAPAR
jgi:hypothetical protein